MPTENNLPATKQDIALVQKDLAALQSAVDRRFEHVDQRFDQLKNDLVEQMRDMQTEVLRAFHGQSLQLGHTP